MIKANHFIIHTDGGARGNPGPAGIGAVIEKDGLIVAKLSRYIGETTNNQAEYRAIIMALEYVAENNGQSAELYSDSELVIKQLRGEYRVKNKDLGPVYIRARSLIASIGRVDLVAIRRENNTLADSLVNQALDEHATGR